MKSYYKGRDRASAGKNAGAFLRAALLVGVCMGIISAKPGKAENTLTFSDVLNLLEEQSHPGGSGNRDAAIDYLRQPTTIPVTCNSRGLCNCYSKALRRFFCCDCLNGPCFPSDARVTTPKGHTTMADLTVGDLVLAGTKSGGLVWSPVVAWLDRRPNEDAQYLSLNTDEGSSLTISSSHLLFTSESEQMLSKFAGDVTEGESLWTVAEESLLTKIDSKSDSHVSLTSPSSSIRQALTSANITKITPVIKKGAYVPLTETGTIFVNGVLASCYASVTHDIAHSALAPLRWLPSWITGGQYEGTMPFVTMLKWIASNVLPSRYLAPREASVEIHQMHDLVNNEWLSAPCFLKLISNVFHMFAISV